MMDFLKLCFQIHKYKNGHQLVASTIQLEREDQDTIDRLSDLSGQLRPGELFDPYFTCYPLPSKKKFVVARTWQDLTAVRAGCVITKSIIIPMQEWKNTNQIPMLFELLLNSDRSLTFPTEHLVKNNNYGLVLEAPVEELVEALFLEQRKPILVIDGKESTQIIIRLYSVFWSSLRENFATCTFALSPRTIEGRLFDLLFTQNTLRNRFSNWNGRRIEGSTHNRKAARHRWTEDLEFRIFKTNEPSLYKNNGQSPFDFFDSKDESILRLSLLWDELLKKAAADSSPMAVLGLLDIINSQPAISQILYKSIEVDIKNSITNATKYLSISDAWKFYGGLLVKNKHNLISIEMLKEIKSSCILLTISSPTDAIDFILKYNPSLEETPLLLYEAIGDGISEIFHNNEQKLLKNIPDNLGIRLLATSINFADLLMSLLYNRTTEINAIILSYFNASNSKISQKAKNNLLPFIDSPVHKLVFSLELNDSSSEQYKKVISNVAQRTSLHFNDFDDLILKESIKHDETFYLLDLLVSIGKMDKLTVQLLQFQPELINSFLSDTRIDVDVKNNILVEVINSLNYESLQNLSLDKNISRKIFSILLSNDNTEKKVLGEFILLADIPTIDALSVFCNLPSMIINNIRQDKLYDLIKEGISISSLKSLIFKILDKLNKKNANNFVEYILYSSTSANFTNEYFEILSSAKILKKTLIERIDIISEILSENLPAVANDIIYKNWIYLLTNADNTKKQQVASVKMLEYSFKKAGSDPTNLISASFPIIYNYFLNEQSMSQIISFWIFPDWDKCKTLKYDLINYYINSNWSIVGLLEVAKKTGIEEEIFSIIKHSSKGQKFLETATIKIHDFPSEKSLSKKKHSRKKKK